MTGRPAYVDEHARLLPGVPPERAYAAARSFAERLTRTPTGVLGAFTRVWGTEPASGFAIVDDQPPAVVTLAGRHRCSRYEMDLRVDPAAGGSVVTVVTLADFPGVRGTVYRAALVGSRGHVVAVRMMLRSIARVA